MHDWEMLLHTRKAWSWFLTETAGRVFAKFSGARRKRKNIRATEELSDVALGFYRTAYKNSLYCAKEKELTHNFVCIRLTSLCSLRASPLFAPFPSLHVPSFIPAIVPIIPSGKTCLTLWSTQSCLPQAQKGVTLDSHGGGREKGVLL